MNDQRTKIPGVFDDQRIAFWHFVPIISDASQIGTVGIVDHSVDTDTVWSSIDCQYRSPTYYERRKLSKFGRKRIVSDEHGNGVAVRVARIGWCLLVSGLKPSAPWLGRRNGRRHHIKQNTRKQCCREKNANLEETINAIKGIFISSRSYASLYPGFWILAYAPAQDQRSRRGLPAVWGHLYSSDQCLLCESLASDAIDEAVEPLHGLALHIAPN